MVASSMAIHAPDQTAVAGRDVEFVLVPRLARLARGFDEQHGLHAFHRTVPVRQVRGGDARQHVADPRVMDEALHHRADVVRLVDAQQVLQHLTVGVLCGQRLEALARVMAARQAHHVVLQLLQFGGAYQSLADQEALVDEKACLVGGRRARGLGGGGDGGGSENGGAHVSRLRCPGGGKRMSAIREYISIINIHPGPDQHSQGRLAALPDLWTASPARLQIRLVIAAEIEWQVHCEEISIRWETHDCRCQTSFRYRRLDPCRPIQHGRRRRVVGCPSIG